MDSAQQEDKFIIICGKCDNEIDMKNSEFGKGNNEKCPFFSI